MSHTPGRKEIIIIGSPMDKILKIVFNFNIHSIKVGKRKTIEKHVIFGLLMPYKSPVHAPRKSMSRISITYS